MRVAIMPFLLAAAAFGGQHWEAGALAGGGFEPYRPTLTGPSGAADVGFGNGPVFGAFLVQHLYSKVSGEIRYEYSRSDLRISGAKGSARMRGESHAVHYDWLFFTRPRKARVRPYLAAGAGFKLYRGVGAETAYQPLQDIAVLTRTREWKPLVSVGAGVAFTLSAKICMRLEFRDAMTPFPKRVIAPTATGAAPGWLHEIVPAVTIGLQF